MTERNRTGKFPSIDQIGKVSDQEVQQTVDSVLNTVKVNPQMSKAVGNKVDEITKEVSGRSDKNSLLGDDGNNLNDYIIDFSRVRARKINNSFL